MVLAQKAQQPVVEGITLRQVPKSIEGLGKEMLKRIALCRNTFRANCIGTARYLLGQEEDDVFVPAETGFPTYLAGLKRLNEPKLGCIVVWTWKPSSWLGEPLEIEAKTGKYPIVEVYHMGIVTSLEPLGITHREKTRGRFIENQPIAELQKEYDSMHFVQLFYAP
jgi:hypothetical protein